MDNLGIEICLGGSQYNIIARTGSILGSFRYKKDAEEIAQEMRELIKKRQVKEVDENILRFCPTRTFNRLTDELKKDITDCELV